MEIDVLMVRWRGSHVLETVAKKDGQVVGRGTYEVSDDGQRIQLQQPEGAIVVLEKSAIEDRAVGKSGMPEDLVKKITKSDVRDLVEYLSTLRNTVDPAAHGKK